MNKIVMHDNTDVCLVKPKDPTLQLSLYSQYYAGCVANGGVTLQPCRWTVTWELCTGRIDDMAYVNTTKLFETQQSLVLHDVTSSNTFINFFDCGYLCYWMLSSMEANTVFSQFFLNVTENLIHGRYFT